MIQFDEYLELALLFIFFYKNLIGVLKLGKKKILMDAEKRWLSIDGPEFIAKIGISAGHTVVDFGCGDGFQIGLLDVPHYTGLDVSPAALELCRTRFADRAGWRFLPAADRAAWAGRYDMAMSLDVIFHLVETEVFEAYMHDLFAHADRLVLIYSSDVDHDAPGRHVLHRNVTRWTAENLPHWRQTRAIPNPFGREIDQPHDRRTSVARFMVYEPAARA